MQSSVSRCWHRDLRELPDGRFRYENAISDHGDVDRDALFGRPTRVQGRFAVGGTVDADGMSSSCNTDEECTQFDAGWSCEVALGRCLPPDEELCTLGRFHALPDRCTALCETQADCGDEPDMVCSRIPLLVYDNASLDPSDDVESSLSVCLFLAGSRSPCAKDSECTGDEVCRPLRDLDGVSSFVCGAPNPDGYAPGERCAPGVPHLGCANGMCDPHDGDGFVTTGTCAAPCTVDADCPSPLVCRDWRPSRLDDEPVKACRTPEAVDDFTG